jgi:hypothetical protein
MISTSIIRQLPNHCSWCARLYLCWRTVARTPAPRDIQTLHQTNSYPARPENTYITRTHTCQETLSSKAVCENKTVKSHQKGSHTYMLSVYSQQPSKGRTFGYIGSYRTENESMFAARVLRVNGREIHIELG